MSLYSTFQTISTIVIGYRISED